MKTIDLSENMIFSDKRPHAEPLHVDPNGRVLLFAMEPGQTIREHSAPSSPFYAVVLQGRGFFAGEDGNEQEIGPNKLLVFDPGEIHFVRAIDRLVFIGFLHGAPGAQR